MYNFGKIPPRALRGSGVAGLLGPECRVFYDSLFSPVNFGKMMDLLTAKLRDQGLDELDLRAILLFSFFEAYRAQIGGKGAGDPLIVECGLDEEKVALGIAFHLENDAGFLDGLAQRIGEGAPSDSFEALLAVIYEHSDHLVLRFDPKSRRAEVISLMGIPGKIELPEKQLITVILPEEHAQQEDASSEGVQSPAPVEAKEYIQLGDLDYVDLLQEKLAKKEPQPARRHGEILARSFAGEKIEEQLTTVSGDHSDLFNNEVIRVSGSSGQPDNTVIRVSAGTEAIEPDKFSVQAMLQKFWPFQKKESGESPALPAPAEPVATPDFKDDDLKEMTHYLVTEVSTGSFAKFAESIQEKAREAKKEAMDEAWSKWVESVSHGVTMERARMMDVVKKISVGVRQKELELRKREQGFADDLRKRDDLVHQKTAALTRAKEQLAQASSQIEKYKNAHRTVKGPSTEESNLKQKIQHATRMIGTLKEKNAQLAKKLDETRKSQLAVVKTEGPNTSDLAKEVAYLKSRNEQVMRQYIQVKGLNEQLVRRAQHQAERQSTERAESAKVTKQTPPSDEFKKRFETATKLANAQQKEIDKLRHRIEEITRESNRLKGQLNKAHGELRAAKLSATTKKAG